MLFVKRNKLKQKLSEHKEYSESFNKVAKHAA